MLQGQIVDTELTDVVPTKARRYGFAKAFYEVCTPYWDTLGTQVLTAGLGIISGLLLPRLLGPQGRGELAAVTLWPLALIFLGSLSLDRAAVFFSSKHRRDISPVASACIAIGTMQTLLVIIIGAVIIPITLRSHGPQTVKLGIFFLLSAPLVQASTLQGSLLLGNLETKSYNACRIIPPLLYALGVAILFSFGVPSIPTILVLQVIGIALAAFLASHILVRKLRPCWQWNFPLVKRMLKYGVKTHIGELTGFMNQRLDQLLISLFLPSSQLGIYVAAVAFTDGLLIIPRGVGTFTLAAGSNSDATEARHLAKRSLLLTTLWLVPAAIALWFLSPVIIPLLFGTRFSPSIAPCRILIFGTCASGLSTVLGEAARSVNRPEIPSYAELAGLVATITLLAALLKPYGPIGAAIASTVAYASTLAFNLCFFTCTSRPSQLP
jgi:O-antigen/teichoic acid export membrane protein